MYYQIQLYRISIHKAVFDQNFPVKLLPLYTLCLAMICPITLYAQSLSWPPPPAQNSTVPVSKMSPLPPRPPKLLSSVEVYPKRIYYGDIFFTTITLYNPGTEPIIIGRHDGPTEEGYNAMLLYSGNIVCKWPQDSEGGNNAGSALWGYTYYIIEPQTTLKLRLRCFWFPIHEVSAIEDMNHFLGHSWNSEGTAFQFSQVESIAAGIKPNEILPPGEVFEHGNSDNLDPVSTDHLIIAPRWNKDLELLKEWYLELPGLGYSGWYNDYVFSKPQYIRGAPRIIPRPSDVPEEMFRVYRSDLTPEVIQKLDEYDTKTAVYFEQYEKFIQSIMPRSSGSLEQKAWRTPELLIRANRTNELAAKIIERSKDPDSTFSQNMVEFIQLRGFLVDMRYAENPEAEEAAFEKLMDFVEQSQDKELWVDFIHEIGFRSIAYYEDDGSWYMRLEKYRKRFAERFQITQPELVESPPFL